MCGGSGANTYYFDSDGDGLGAGNSESYCSDSVPDGWVANNDDPLPDCDVNQYDCSGSCGGSAVVDGCGQCVGGNTGLSFNYALDDCGVCFGPGSVFDCGCYDQPAGDCDCFGNVVDECGVCGGSGPNANFDCDGNCTAVIDCAGT